ncbi:hypothetical protein K7X08_038035 [Anisodus acutangulus]|uniref:Uncharacterized protein n=1 Tax=Anisodus acutangulus TaxID=402998 RepID=A0A9Q1RT69_9SOLA|nr:hypothetical protein K7X08_038035 [Anisodus acutangulus]
MVNGGDRNAKTEPRNPERQNPQQVGLVLTGEIAPIIGLQGEIEPTTKQSNRMPILRRPRARVCTGDIPCTSRLTGKSELYKISIRQLVENWSSKILQLLLLVMWQLVDSGFMVWLLNRRFIQ